MNYTTLLDMVNVQLCPIVLQANTDKLPEYRQILLTNQQDISSALRNIHHQSNASEIIQKHQMALCGLSNLVFDYRGSLDDTPHHSMLDNFYLAATKIFDDLLDYVIKEYPREVHRHFSIPAPHSYILRQKVEFTTTTKEILVHAHNKPIDPNLLELVLKPIKEIINHTGNRVTQRSLLYCQELLRSLIWVTESDGLDKRIYYALMHMNFNSYEYYFYCNKKLENKLKELHNNASRMELLLRFENEILANPSKYPDIALFPNEAPWATQMLNRIEIEKNFIRSNPDLRKKEEGNVENTPFKTPKLETSLSVRELGVMVRAYIDAGIIAKMSVTAIRQFITKSLSTKSKRDLSENSFKNKYYNPSTVTLAKCKKLLQHVITIITEYENSEKKSI